MPNAHVAAAATGLPAPTLSRRRMLLGLAAVSTAAPAATALLAREAPQAPVLSADLAEVVAIFDQLTPDRKARMLATFRDCLAAQRVIERCAPGA